MPDVLDWQRADPRKTLVHTARLLRSGRPVAFPTETGYTVAASALCPEAAAAVARAGGQTEIGPLTVAVSGPGEAPDWVPALGRVGRRLARRCWPGPVTLQAPGAGQGLASRLPAEVRARAVPADEVRLRAPAHEAILEVMRLLPGPLVLGPDGDGPATAEEAARVFADAVALVIDDGPGRFTRPPTVVRLEEERWEVVREGVLSRAALERVLPCRILFICTGNTCRSPLAEALCKKLLAKRLGCPPEELPGRGFFVHSAGIAAMMGGGAAAEAVQTAQELGADLSGHRSQPLTADLLAQADHVLAMTRGHLRALTGRPGPGGPVPRLLAADGGDIPDPIGGPPEVYQECAGRILRHLEVLLPELL
jgi:protein-tyrosine phosphatase